MPSADIGGVLHTDASLSGLGAAWLRPGREPVYYSALVPPGFSDYTSGTNEIYLLELAAAVLGASLIGSLRDAPRDNVVVGVDNNASLVSLLRGYGACDKATNYVLQFWSKVDASGSVVWVERVRSRANRADFPSRCPRDASVILLPFPSK